MAVLAAGTALAGCTTRWCRSSVDRSGRSAETPPPVVAPAPKAAIGTFGFDKAGMDRSVQPGDDFYAFANGTWAKTTQIPADKSNYGMFTVLLTISRSSASATFSSAAKDDPASKIGTAYASFLDEAAVEAKGLAPIEPWLNEIRGLKERGGLRSSRPRPTAMGSRHSVRRLHRPGRQEPRTATSRSLAQSGLGMPDRDYYLSNDAEARAEARGKYLAASDQRADSRGRDECGRARQGDPRFRNRHRQGLTGRGSRAATRPRPTTR